MCARSVHTMSRPYQSQTVNAHYFTPIVEAVVLVRTSQRYRGVAQLAEGSVRVVSMYGLPRTPCTDDVLTGLVRLHVEDRIGPWPVDRGAPRFMWEHPS